MKTCFLILFCGIVLHTNAKQVSIVASKSDMELALTLQSYLQKMYQNDTFKVEGKISGKGDVIHILRDKTHSNEAFSIKADSNGSFTTLRLIAGDDRGLYYGVYQLLEELGAGFFLSFEEIPRFTKEVNLKNVNRSAQPLTPKRIVFNWHNFLSGCSAWDYSDWQGYIDQSSKMRFNGLMTHFYANDPTFVYAHNGVWKEPGYMPNTKTGRQYGTQQVNDVRRLLAGDLFEGPVYGSKSSQAAYENRIEEARKLMQKVHKYAHSKHMDIWFGYDVDYELANPQEIMATLPETAKIKMKRKPVKYFGMPDSTFYLPIPDTKEGKAYYKSQVSQLLEQFPEIDNLVLWTRTSGSAFLTMRYEEFPQRWKEEFDGLLKKYPTLDKNDENITGRFATAKIYRTVRNCLNELGKQGIELWAGSWRSTWLKQADMFYPKEVGFIPLDYHTDYFSVQEKQQILAEVSSNRKLLPVVWAHHDDGAIIGAPYLPYENVQDKVEVVGNSGLGVIHWTTKPLDIYFKNTEQQIWSETRNQRIEATADFMSERILYSENNKNLSLYLQEWLKNGPRFGRETRTWFMDHEIPEDDYQNALSLSKKRIELLKNGGTGVNKHLEYFIGLEEFCADFYKTQYNYQKALREVKDGNFSKAGYHIDLCFPEQVIIKYAQVAQKNGITKGEKGIIIEMNLSWLPLINSLRQTLRKSALLYNLGTVNFPDMGVGLLNTNYMVDREKNLWRNYDGEGNQRDLVVNKDKVKAKTEALAEICKEGITSMDKLELEIIPYGIDISPSALRNPGFFMPGNYRLSIICNEHKFSKKGERLFEISLTGNESKITYINEEIDIIALTGEINKVLVKSCSFELKTEEALTLKVKNINGGIVMNGIKLEPIQ